MVSLMRMMNNAISGIKPGKRKYNRISAFETLEARQLMSADGLLGHTIDVPFVSYVSSAGHHYDAVSQILSVNADAVSFRQDQSLPPFLDPKFSNSSFNFSLRIDNSGNLIGGVAGDDLVVSGEITIGGTTYSGVLLTGEILDFGVAGNGPNVTSSFEYLFEITGGSLASFYEGKDFDVLLTAEPLASEPAGYENFSKSFTTVAKGTAGATDLTPSASLGDYVWQDDGNGIQDVGEAGVEGVSVSLYGDLNDDGVIDFDNELIDTATTDSTGFYEFLDLTAGVQYQVKFDKPANSNFTVALQGSDRALDSDVDVNTGLSGFVTLKPGEHNPTIDAGILGGTGSSPKASLGDFVWHDTGNSSHAVNGIQDADELGIANVKVELLNSSGQVIASTYTDANGYYLFENLEAGSYRTRIATSNFATGGVLNGWYATLQNVGNDAKDSDGDRVTYTSQLVTLAAGTQDLSLDFGFFTTGVEIDKSAPLTAKPGQTITYTFTITNTGDVEIDGGKLYDPLLSRCGQPIWCGTIKAGQTVTFSVQYTIPCYFGCGDLINTATFTGSPDDPGRLCLPKVTDSDTVTTTVSNKPSNNNGGCNNNPPKDNNCGGNSGGSHGNQCDNHDKHRPSNKHRSRC